MSTTMGMAEEDGVRAFQLVKSVKNDTSNTISTRIASTNEATAQHEPFVPADEHANPSLEVDSNGKHADADSKSQKSAMRPTSAQPAKVEISEGSSWVGLGKIETDVRGSVEDEDQMRLDDDFLFSEEEDRFDVVYFVCYVAACVLFLVSDMRLCAARIFQLCGTSQECSCMRA